MDFEVMGAYLFTAMVVALPTMIGLIAIDSLYYGYFTIVPVRFLVKNIVEKISLQYGVEAKTYYMFYTIPFGLNFMYFLFLAGAILYSKNQISKKKVPYLTIYLSTYLFIFSFVQHKEDRFLLSLFPIFFILSAYFITRIVQTHPILAKASFLIVVIYELVLSVPYYALDSHLHAPFYDLRELDLHPTQLFHHSSDLDIQLYTLLHDQDQERADIVKYYNKLHGDYGGLIQRWAGFNGYKNYWVMRDILQMDKQGYWPLQYMIIDNFLQEDGEVQRNYECFTDLLEYYDLIEIYGNVG